MAELDILAQIGGAGGLAALATWFMQATRRGFKDQLAARDLRIAHLESDVKENATKADECTERADRAELALQEAIETLHDYADRISELEDQVRALGGNLGS